MAIGGKRRFLFAMFVLLCILIFVVTVESASTGDLNVNVYYYSGGRKIKLSLSKQMVAVRFEEGVSLEQQESLVLSEPVFGLFFEREEISIFNLTLLPLCDNATEADAAKTIKIFDSKSGVKVCYPVFHFHDDDLILTDEFIVKFDKNISEEQIESFNAQNGVEILRKPDLHDRYKLRVKDPTKMNTLRTANLYYESPITVFSMPNFIRKFKKSEIIPDDTYFTQQWPLDNTGFNSGETQGTLDADIDTPYGWDVTNGSSNIIIAIIDEGVDLGHEDLVNNLVGGYDFVENDSFPNPSYGDAHGTACAGLASAQTNNGIGISGVGWDCKIMPIRIASSEFGGWSTEEWASDGIIWASNNGADVLSNSWYWSSDSDIIHNAIIQAKNNGRNGKGCVLVFGSANKNGPVEYPAKYTEVISVGATDDNDERWSIGPGNGSNFGPELDVVAPTGWGLWDDAIMWTTDINGDCKINFLDFRLMALHWQQDENK